MIEWQILEKNGVYTSGGKPLYLCDYSPTQVIGDTRKIFDPVVEFFNRKGKPNFEYGMQDWLKYLVMEQFSQD